MKYKALIVLALAAFWAAPAPAQTLEEVIERNIEARGGLEAWQAIETVYMTGEMELGMGAQGPITVEFKRPNKMRFEFTMEDTAAIQAFDGKTAWVVFPFGDGRPQKLTEEQAAEIVDQADFEGPLIRYREKGHKVELLGRGKVGDVEVFELELTHKNGNLLHLFLSTETYLEIRQSLHREIQGKEVEIVVDVSDYRRVGGVLIPFRISQGVSIAPASQVITLRTVEVGIDLPERRFLFPESN